MKRYVNFVLRISFPVMLFFMLITCRSAYAQIGGASCAVPTVCDTEFGCNTGCTINGANDTLGIYGRADAVFWSLGGSKRALILRDMGSFDQAIFSANDFATTRGTPRIMLGLELTPYFSVEGQYNGFGSWNSSRSLPGNSDLRLPGALGAGSHDYLNADQMDIRAETEFHSAELNFVRKVKRSNFALLGGFRYINFNENIDLNSTIVIAAPNYTSDYLVDAKNKLYGGQVGLKWERSLSNRFGLQFTGKAGLFGNSASQRTWIGDDGNATEVRNVSMKKNKTAFAGELNLGGYYKITEGLSLVGGYNLMWVGDTARAADQFDFTHTTESSRFVATDTLFMHGANVGLDWNF